MLPACWECRSKASLLFGLETGTGTFGSCDREANVSGIPKDLIQYLSNLSISNHREGGNKIH